ncbi:hypothetical protein ABZ815_35675 [Nonomuraea sp. NPDC047529]|uniref:LGFP repeat-containing protein n=1 Tax=Nonomuraea sp. NPDC047529 TaxID=3155623 RepID=UPI0033D660B2
MASAASPSLIGTAAAVLTAAFSLTTSPAAAAVSACDPSLVAPAGSLIGGLWRSNGGEQSVYGCPTTKEFGYPDKKGSWQRFTNGKIVWSPNLGNGTLVRVYQKGQNLVFKWSGLGRDWDYFNVRWSKNGGRATQVQTGRLTAWSGQYLIAPYVQGGVGTTTNGHEVDKFAFIVQGCDRTTFGSDCGPWSIPTSISLAH